MLKFCDSPWNTVNISQNGDVVLCLCPGWQTQGPAGNLNNQTLREIFASHKTQEFRNSIYNQTFKFCDSNVCGRYWSMDSVNELQNIPVPSLPTSIYLQDLDRSCNLACPSCRSDFYHTKEINSDARHVLNSLIEAYQNFDHTVLIQGDGRGEMLMSTAYLEFLSSDRLPSCFKFSINSNGNLLSKNIDLITKIKNQISGITVSMDASTPATYQKIRGGNFGVMVNGMKQVIDLGIPVITQFVVQYGNYKEILSYRDLCKDMGVTFSGLQGISPWAHMTNQYWLENRIKHNYKVDYNWLVSALLEFKNSDNCGIDGQLETIIQSPQVLESEQRGIMWLSKAKINSPSIDLSVHVK